MSCCSNSQFVTLFADGTRPAGTEEVIFDTKQAEKIYYFRDMKLIFENVLATIENTVDSTVDNLGNSVDQNLATFSDMDIGANTGEILLRFNFQTQTSRSVNAKFRASNPLVTWRTRWAASDLVFSSFSSPVGMPTSTATIEIQPTQNLQYVELFFETGSTSQRTIDLFEVLKPLTISNVNIQVKNEITGNFFTVESLSTLAPESDTERIDTQTAIQPNNSFTRIQLNNRSDWTGSVGALLVDPKFNT